MVSYSNYFEITTKFEIRLKYYLTYIKREMKYTLPQLREMLKENNHKVIIKETANNSKINRRGCFKERRY